MASIRERLPTGWRLRRGDSIPIEPDEDEPEEQFAEMTLREHLEELRTRVLYSALAIAGGFILGLILANPVLKKIAKQAQVPTTGLVAISPTEPFTVFMKVALYIAIAFAMPVLIWQFTRFLAPGLTRRERRFMFRAIPFICLMFVAGVCFAFFVLAPRALKFLSGFNSSVFDWQPRAQEIISFYLTLMIGVGLMFELPIVIFALSSIGVVNTKRLTSIRKFAVILVMIAAAIITPTPDPFNMMLVAVPMYALYELGIILSRFAKH
jgi:sec-independent protein translocase protein TatC